MKTNKRDADPTTAQEHEERSIALKKKVNALYPTMEKAFENIQKEINNTPAPYDEFSNVSGMQLLTDDIVDIPKLVDPILHRVGIAAFVGSSDVGKSALLRHLCVSVIKGNKFLDW